MNKDSKEIIRSLNEANNIIAFCHEGPDIDSIVSCLLMKKHLLKMKKNIDIVSADRIRKSYQFLDPNKVIKVKDPNKIDFSQYDILFALDLNELRRFGIKGDIDFKGEIINIDHHEGSPIGKYNYIDTKAGSTGSIVYELFKKWGFSLDKEDLDNVLLSLVADTGVFHYSIYGTSKIFQAVSELIDKGANYDRALYYTDQNFGVKVMKYWAEAINRIKVDKENRFAYTIIPYNIQKKYERYGISTRQVADNFLRNIESTDFGMVIVEYKDGTAKVSVRTRTPGYYVSDLVKRLGGGGHLTGGGATIKEKTFEIAVKKILNAAKNYKR